MVRYVPLVLAVGLLLYGLLDCGGTDARRVRNLPKAVWLLLIVFVPIAGPLAWLLGGRPARQSGDWPVRPGPAEPVRGAAPDDDPEFLAELGKHNAENVDFLKKWEDDLRRREQQLREPHEGDDPPKPEGPAA